MNKKMYSLMIHALLIAGFFAASSVYAQNRMLPTSERTNPNQEAELLVPYADEKLGRFETAIQGYLQQISNIESSEGLYSPELIEPLLGLSRSNLALSELNTAQDSASRAQHLQHRDSGVLALSQLDVVEIKTRIHLIEGELEKADKQQHFAFFLSEKHHGENSHELLPATYKLIDWYTATGQYYTAQRMLNRTIKSFSDSESQHANLLPALLRSSRLRRLRGISGQHKHLEQAVAVITKNPDIPQARQTEVYLALADAYLINGRYLDAQKYYQLSWDNLLTENDVEQFSQPKELALSNFRNKPTAIQNTNYRLNNIEQVQRNTLNLRLSNRDVEEDLITPKKLVLPFQEDSYSVLFESESNDLASSRTFKVIGEPFRFVHSQLLDLLPHRFKSEEELATIRVSMAFSVNAEGRTHNIKVSSNYTHGRLHRAMRRILAKTRFRPRLEDGKRVATSDVKLVQTFRIPAA